MAALSNSLILGSNSPSRLSSGSLKAAELGTLAPTNFSFTPVHVKRASQKPLVVRASYSDGGRHSAGNFIGGFILGGLVVGTLGLVYAPQISKVIAGTDRKELMRKLPKFIYDEEKALEKTRKILTEKIEQLNSAIDDVSAQLHPEGKAKAKANGAAVNSDEVEGLEAAI